MLICLFVCLLDVNVNLCVRRVRHVPVRLCHSSDVRTIFAELVYVTNAISIILSDSVSAKDEQKKTPSFALRRHCVFPHELDAIAELHRLD